MVLIMALSPSNGDGIREKHPVSGAAGTGREAYTGVWESVDNEA